MSERSWFLLLALACVALATTGAHLGLTPHWNPDEIGPRAYAMAQEGTVQPPDYLYPSLHYYLLMGVQLLCGDDRAVCLFVSRLVSALAAAGIVLVIGLGLRGELSRRARLAAAFALAFSYGLVSLAHWSTIDVTACFLATTAIVLAVRDRLVAAAVVAGLAAGAKYNAGLALLPVLVAYALRHVPTEQKKASRGQLVLLFAAGAALVAGGIHYRSFSLSQVRALGKLLIVLGAVPLGLAALAVRFPRWRSGLRFALRDRRLAWILLGAAGAFLLSTPTLLVHPRRFLHDFLTVATTASHYKTVQGGGVSFGENALHLLDGAGLAVVLAAILGAPRFLRPEHRRLRLFLVFSVPYFLILGTWARSHLRWMLPCLPTIAVAAGLFVEGVRVPAGRKGVAVRAAGVLAVLLVIARALAAPLESFRDPRVGAARDYCAQLAPGTRVAVFAYDCYLPVMPGGVEVVSYSAGFDTYPAAPEKLRTLIRSFETARADYVVLTSLWWPRYLRAEERHPIRAGFFRELLAGLRGYRVVAEFEEAPLVRFLPAGGRAPPYLLPRITVLARDATR